MVAKMRLMSGAFSRLMLGCVSTLLVVLLPVAQPASASAISTGGGATSAPSWIPFNRGALVEANPASANFGNVIVGNQALIVVTLTSTRGASSPAVTITGSGDFSINSNACNGTLLIPFGAGCVFLVVYNPTTLGSATATITSPGLFPSIPVTGTGIPSTAPTDLIINGGFENVDSNGQTGPEWGFITPDQYANYPCPGAFCPPPNGGLRYGKGSPGISVSQTAPVPAACSGVGFNLTWWHFSLGTEHDTIHFNGSGAPDITQDTYDFSAPVVSPSSISSTIPPGTTSVTVTFANTAPFDPNYGGGILVDNVSFIVTCP